MTKEEFRAMEKSVGMTFYVIANVNTCKPAGKLVKVFKDSVILDFTADGVYNNVDHRLFRCEEISAEPVTKAKPVNSLPPKYRCEETGEIYATIYEAAAACQDSVSGLYLALHDGRAFKGYHFTQLGGI